jgi:hypothetical protein
MSLSRALRVVLDLAGSFNFELLTVGLSASERSAASLSLLSAAVAVSSLGYGSASCVVVGVSAASVDSFLASS